MKAFRLLVLAATLALPWTVTVQPVAVSHTAVLAADPPVAGDAPAPKIDVNIRGGETWYANPVILAVAGIGFLVLVLVVALAARGGGTTIVKE